MKRRIESSSAPFVACGDRFVENYRPNGLTTEQVWEEYGKMPEIAGINLVTPLEFDLEYTKKRIHELGKVVSTVAPDTWMNAGIKNGQLMNRDAGIRREQIAMIKDSMDICAELNGADILLWQAHDGYTYPFEDNYNERIDYLMQSLDEICSYRDDVRVTIEYKYKEPKTYQYISDVGKSLYICEKVKRDNLGIVVDIGHSLMVKENPSEALAWAARENKLFHVHLNDNYRGTDDDMIVGSVHFWETLEFFYQMDAIGYDGWLNLDIWPAFMDNGKAALEESIKRVRMFERLAEALPRETIQKLQREHKLVEIMEIVRETCIK